MSQVSVIIPNYNHAKFLKLRIDSVLNQTYQDFEIILLDDCSTDNSKEIIESYRYHNKIVHIIYNKINSGSTFKQWAKGLQFAKGKYVWIAESDDYCEENFLEELVKLHKTKVNIGLAYCKSLPIDANNKITDHNDGWLKRVDNNRWDSDFFNLGINECENYLAIQCTIPNASAVLFSKIALSKIDIMKFPYKVCGDWKVYASILIETNIAYTIKTKNFHRGHSENARSIFSESILNEQLSIMEWMTNTFKVVKSQKYNLLLDEKVKELITLVRLSRSINNNLFLFRKMQKIDKLLIIRTLKVGIYTLLRMKIGL